jgi:hypothetical protein
MSAGVPGAAKPRYILSDGRIRFARCTSCFGASPLRIPAVTSPTFHVGLPGLNPFRITVSVLNAQNHPVRSIIPNCVILTKVGILLIYTTCGMVLCIGADAVIRNGFKHRISDVKHRGRCKTSGRGMESLYRSGEAPKQDVYRMKSGHRIKQIGLRCSGYPPSTIPRRFTLGYRDQIRSGLQYQLAIHKTILRTIYINRRPTDLFHCPQERPLRSPLFALPLYADNRKGQPQRATARVTPTNTQNHFTCSITIYNPLYLLQNQSFTKHNRLLSVFFLSWLANPITETAALLRDNPSLLHYLRRARGIDFKRKLSDLLLPHL